MRVNLADGTTLTFDLDSAIDRTRWESFQSDYNKQQQIRGVVLTGGGMEVAVPSPLRFRRVDRIVERCLRPGTEEVLAEKVTILADDVSLEVLSYTGRPVVRVSLTRSGRPMFLSHYRRDHE